MFSNTAYEALYEYIGLSLHGKFIQIITSQKIFLAALMLIFGTVFFITTLQFFSKYLPGSIVKRRSVPLSKYVRIVFALFIGISILQVSSKTSVKRFNGQSWNTNPYIQGKLGNTEPDYQVSFLFDLLSRSAEEVSALIAKAIDELFSTTHSQLNAPNFFFKAILYSGTATIDDPTVASAVDFYSDQCMDRVVSLIAENENMGLWDKFWSTSADIDTKLNDVVVTTADGAQTTCYELKSQVLSQLTSYSRSRGNYMGAIYDAQMQHSIFNPNQLQNLATSQLLLNHFNERREGFLGIEKGAELPSGAASWFQTASKIFSWDSLARLFSNNYRDPTSHFGASLAAKKAEEFNQNLARAPHVAGAVKMILIFIFPWLIFLVVAGNWKVFAYWYLAYFSVLLWTPLWTLFYHIMVGISQSAEQMQAFSNLTDGISLYSSELILHRMNYLFAVFSWIQILVGILLSGTILMSVRPLLSDNQSDTAPDFIGDASQVATTGAKVGGML